MVVPITAKNTLISPNFLVWKFCGKHSLNTFPKIFTPGNYLFFMVYLLGINSYLHFYQLQPRPPFQWHQSQKNSNFYNYY